jgi:hypothetical protein
MLRIIKILLLLPFLIAARENCMAFQQSVIKGFVKDSTGLPIENVSVSISGTGSGGYTGKSGFYSIRAGMNGKECTLVFSHIGFRSETRTIRCDIPEITIDIILRAEVSNLGEITVSSQKLPLAPGLTAIPVKDINLLPSPSGSFEAILKTMPGVASHNELSSQYSVRGGNYDENLVYVNDVEIFRPFLIRSGQQEGLSFINPDLVESVNFSSGGFDASYGDKMSSVLDIKYRKPVSFHGSVSLGLLTSSVHLEGADKTGRLTFLVGARYKSSSMMLKTLDAKGDYHPVFADIQSILTWKTGPGSNLSLLASYASNTYKYIPESMTSSFGTEAEAYQLYVLFEGGEKDRYSTFNGALAWELADKGNVKHKFLLSSYVSDESETFDIRGSYRLDNLDKNTGSENFSDSIMNIGIGSFLSHARNKLLATILSFQYNGEKESGKISLKWGLGIREQHFDDRLKEWKMEDSAGYSVPYNTESLRVSSLISTVNNLITCTGDAWFESTGKFMAGSNEIRLNAGIRGLYDSFTDEILASPRFSAKLTTEGKLAFWLSGGWYYQPPLYREMRFPDGTINDNIRSQKSIHMIAGMSYDFMAWERPFRLTAEIYNKILSDIIPYYMDNVRLIYSGENSAEGFSRGLDLRLNGEFVEGAESWISLSLMDSRLVIPSSGYGWFPTPSDQTFSTNIFFQDYFPGYPTWRAHITIAFATGLPIISPFSDRYDQYYRLPPYRRVDLGMTKIIKSRNSVVSPKSFFRFFDELVAGVEIFNLLDINNTVSYFWVRTLNNLSGQSREYAIPDYLTGRCLNLKIMAKF